MFGETPQPPRKVPSMHRALSSLHVGLLSLRANPTRTVLSTLGVVIGVAAVVAILAVGDGVERVARQSVCSTTALQSVVVSPVTERWVDGRSLGQTDWPLFTVADLDSLAARLESGSRAELSVVGTALATDQEGSERALAFKGIVRSGCAEEREQTGATLLAGRHLTNRELRDGEFRVEMSHSLAVALGAGGRPDSLVGETVTLGGVAYTVVGIRDGRPGARLQALAPLVAAEFGFVDGEQARTMTLTATSVEGVDVVQAAAGAWLEEREGANWAERVDLQLNRYRLEQVQRGFLIFKLLMGSIAGISLVTGGIGIMNVLLASVLERTREIGVRKATGARRRDIVVQFLGEAVSVTGAGCVLGLGLGLAAAFGITAIMRAQTEAVVYAAVTVPTVAVALSLALVVGLGFGLYPALRASRLSPIAAMRHE